MAFRTPTPAQLALAEEQLPRGLRHLRAQHEAAATALATATDTTEALAAIKTYRAARAEMRETVRQLAMMLILAGAPSSRTCAELRISRTALQRAMLTTPWAAAMIDPGDPPIRRAA